ncbi:MAG: hypothetical protein A2289_10885 [Deltaproteobacteria bacterium RIFOXYA12_FULL_58_15]|nr:MAG: hypothetical protein A2289_10885 [Deltaproteobacteria bacterium RIFOXYA12_FULL_58_15]OGR09928.1 MAG: hypothetical protein A2341_27415 [Deltaproteobacteria bacterium RIFOXYB12_FULL_58_9]
MNPRIAGVWIVVLAGAGCGNADENPDVPVTAIMALGGTVSGEVSVAFTVSDRQSRLVNVSFFQGTSSSPQGPASPAATSVPTLGLQTTPEGKPYSFLWDTVADVGYERSENVHLLIKVTSGAQEGIGDETGPFVVDNTGLAQAYHLTGNICRSSIMQGTATGDLSGKLLMALFLGNQGYPPSGAALDGEDLGTHDFTNTADCVAYSFPALVPDNYQVIAVLDADEDNLSPLGGFVIDAGDLTNAGGTQIQIVSSDVQQNVVLNYYCTPPACQ